MADETKTNDSENEPKEKVVYEKSTAQRAAEAFAEEQKKLAEGDPSVVGYRTAVQPTYGLQEDGGYIGTSPEYRNAADERQKPFNPEDGWTEALQVEPAEDAGEPSEPFVRDARPGGPAVQSAAEEEREAAKTAASTATSTKATLSTKSPTPPASKSSK